MKQLIFSSLLLFTAFKGNAQQVVENLGSKVNSIYSEARPTISADGKTLYFIVEGNPKNKAYFKDKKAQDVWYSELDAEGNWGQAIQATSALNDVKDNAIFWVAPDASRLLIRGAYEKGKYVGRGVSMVQKTADGWSAPERLKIKGLKQMSVDKYGGASMASDGKTLLLYFSEEKFSYLNDIYVSFLEENEEWSAPKFLGASINTDDFDEISPFLAADGKSLYFSSDRPGGVGGYDIWMSKRIDNTWTNWTTPQNLGDTINTPQWDAYFAIDAKGEYAYLATTKNTIGGTDLAKIKLNDRQKPENAVLIYGKLYNAKTNDVINNAQIFYDLVPGETSEGNAITMPDGSYKVALPYGKIYSIRASADKYFSVIDTLDYTGNGDFKEVHRDLYLNPVYADGKVNLDENGNIIRATMDEVDSLGGIDMDKLAVGQILTANNILFDFAKSILRADSYKELNKVANLMKTHPSLEIELSAHTDYIGGYSDNLKLSNDRANASKQFLLSKGIESSRIIAKGYGETTPVASNKTENGRQLNRRVEVRILKK